MKLRSPCLAIALAAVFTWPCAGQTVSGTVFRDYNGDGAQSAGNIEPGLAGAVVTATSGDGSSTNTVSAADGTYSLAAPSGGFPVRVEVTLPAGVPFDFLRPGAAGATPTTFVAASASGVDVGFNDPLDYCQPNPDVMTTCFLQGDPLHVGSYPNLGDMVISVDYDATVASPNHLATGAQTGTVAGVAYQRSSQSLFVAAVLRRHAGWGPLGIGGIYRLDYSGGSPPVVSSFLDVTSIGVPVGTDPRTVPGEDPPGNGPTGNEPGLDNLAYDEVAKVGLGDLDIDEEAGVLYAMSLGARTLYAMDIGSAGNVPASATAFPLPAVACVDGVFRPWAIKVYQGRVFIGGVCSNESISPYPAPVGFVDFPNLVGYVYSMDPADGVFSLELTIPLNYIKGCAVGASGCQWYPWLDLTTASVVASPGSPAHPTPILSDIEFADDGDMIVGFNDRTGLLYGSASPAPNTTPSDTSVVLAFSGGDMLRADFDPGTGTFTLESNGIVGGVVGAGSGNNEGPGGGEYYSASTGGAHFELSQGGYAVLRGAGSFVGSAMDPVIFNSGGLLWMHDKGATPGARLNGYTLFDIATPGGFRKSAGVGDTELRCDEAPIEIGNRVWSDDDSDGVQDPGEAPISGVTVTLTCPSVNLATVTDANGLYLFSGVPKDTDCEITIDPADAALNGAGITVAGAGAGNVDSDGVLSGGLVRAAFTTGGPGENDHTYDFGFGPPDLVITKENGGASPGGTIVYTLTVTNIGIGTALGVQVTDNVPPEVQGLTTAGCLNDPAGAPTCILGDIAPGVSVAYTITGTIDPALPAGTMIANVASVSAANSEPVTSNNMGSSTVTLVAPVPTLSQWGLLAFALLLAAGALRFVRR